MDSIDYQTLSAGTLQSLVISWNRDSLSGVVRVESSFGTGHIWFDRGQIVDAQLGSLRAEAALGRLVGATEGRYRIEPAGSIPSSFPSAGSSGAPAWSSSVSSWPAAPGTEGVPRIPLRASPQAKNAYAALSKLKPLETVSVDRPSGQVVNQERQPPESGSTRSSQPAPTRGLESQKAVIRTDPNRLVPNMIVSVGDHLATRPVQVSPLPHAAKAGTSTRESLSPETTDPHDLNPGAVVARYEILSCLGRGRMGTIYLVRARGQGGFERLFALKVLTPQLAAGSDAAAALAREAQVMSRVNHTNVVSVLDVGIHQGRAFVVMSYVRGCSLARLLGAQSTLQSPNTLVPVLLDALAGLSALHSAKDENRESLSLVHHDVGPEKFLVGLDGVCRLSDLGLAGLTDLVAGTASGEHRGTTEYLSPERARGNPVDARSDVFAFGAVVWSALTGRSLFKAATLEQTLRNVLEMPIAPPSSLSSSPACLDHLCLKALEREPAKRFQSASEMMTELRRVGTGNGLLGGRSEVATWVKDVVGSGTNFSATGEGNLAHEIARLDGLSQEASSDPPVWEPLLDADGPSTKVKILQWTLALFAVTLLLLALLSPEALETVTFGLVK